MHRPNSVALSVASGRPSLPGSPRLQFYREEFEKLQRCLDVQREFFSEHAVNRAECALTHAMACLDELCGQQDADAVVGDLLKRFELLARLSAWSDSRPVH